MKKLYLRFGSVIAALALAFANLNANATCNHHLYQDELPESVKKLCRVK